MLPRATALFLFVGTPPPIQAQHQVSAILDSITGARVRVITADAARPTIVGTGRSVAADTLFLTRGGYLPAVGRASEADATARRSSLVARLVNLKLVGMATIPLAEILKLSVAERIQLAGDIWDSIAAEPGQVPLTAAQREELRRRSASYREHPDRAIPVDSALERIEQSLG